MDIGNIQGSMTQNVAGKTKAKAPAKEAVVSDAFKRGSESEQLDADKMKSLKSGKGKKSWGKRDARALLGMGVMIGGMMAATALSGPFGAALMVGSMFGGIAIMAL